MNLPFQIFHQLKKESGPYQVVNNHSLCLIFSISCFHLLMTGIGDTKLDVLGQGDINVSIEVEDTVIHSVMKDVLFVPGLGTNLFSVGSATNNGLEARFQDNMVIVNRKSFQNDLLIVILYLTQCRYFSTKTINSFSLVKDIGNINNQT